VIEVRDRLNETGGERALGTAGNCGQLLGAGARGTYVTCATKTAILKAKPSVGNWLSSLRRSSRPLTDRRQSTGITGAGPCPRSPRPVALAVVAGGDASHAPVGTYRTWATNIKQTHRNRTDSTTLPTESLTGSQRS
jgi:hypothetical protein